MTTFIVRRLIQGIVVLFLSTFMIYTILMVTPGGPADQVRTWLREKGSGGPVPNPGLLKYYIKLYGLDKPYPLNYLTWLFNPEKTSTVTYDLAGNPVVRKMGIDIFGIRGSGVLTGELGNSVSIDLDKPVITLLGARLGNTLALTGLATLFAVLLALPIGIISAIKQYSRLDYSITAFSFVGLSMPSFWLGLMLIIFLAILPRQLHDAGWAWMPYLPTGDTGEGTIDRIYHLVLPVTVLSFLNIAGLSRYVRSSMLEVLRQDYVRTAWAKGLRQRAVILKHALRNALIPLLTVITLSIPGLVGGAIITESVFNYFGMGKLYFEAVNVLDIPLVMGFLLINVALIISANLLADILYAVADPRIRYS